MLFIHLLVLAQTGELTATAGAIDSGYSYAGGALSQGFLTAGLESRFRVAHIVVLEGSLTGIALTSFGVAGTARVGLGFSKVSFTVGIHFRVDDTVAPLSVLPSATVTWRPNAFGFTLGVLDRDVGPLARLAVEFHGFSVAYVPPLGAELGARIPLNARVAFDARAWAFKVFSAFSVGGRIGVSFSLGDAS